ncbi:MAG: DUF4847 family protein [Bacteroidaceae bacterium]|nr:DUF4847 family protein [Bacteroidaceae bacterium]
MKGIAKTAKRLIFVLAMAAIASCNNSDDIGEIFIGHDWKLSYIKDGETTQWSPQGKVYNVKFASNSFDAFTPGGGRISGRWSANGNTREFRCTNIQSEGIDSNDTIATHIMQMFSNATSYDGDTHYLQIIKDKNHFMQFYNR